MATFDEYFARDWNKVILAPYVPHAWLTKWGYFRDVRGLARPYSFYFRGGVLHGIDCKRKGTWLRRAVMESLADIPGSLFVPTENLKDMTHNGKIDSWVSEKTRRNQKSGKNFSVEQCVDPLLRQPRATRHTHPRPPNPNPPARYVTELLQSKCCLHLRGDTTTSRRVFDAVAAGCVPVLISDHMHLPFANQLDWDAFSITITEDDLLTCVCCCF